jgi:site-specific recombinase XerD
MTLPRSAAQVLSGHVTLEIRCIDRILLTFRQPRLQYGKGIHGFFCHHRGNQFVSSALMLPMTEAFAADIHHYIAARGLDLVRFAKGESKDQIAKGYLAGRNGGEQILFAGVAQEKTRIWRTRQRTDKTTGRPYPWLCQEQAMVNHWYFYGFDADFGPFYIKFCGYFPFTGQIYLNGQYAERPAMPHEAETRPVALGSRMRETAYLCRLRRPDLVACPSLWVSVSHIDGTGEIMTSEVRRIGGLRPPAEVTGPLAEHAAAFKQMLIGQGYARGTISAHLGLMSRVSRWLDVQGLPARALADLGEVDRFFAERRAKGCRLRITARSLVPLLDFLRDRQVIGAPVVPAATPAEVLLAEYRTYLEQERAATAGTVVNFTKYAGIFLRTFPRLGTEATQQADLAAALGRLTAAEVVTFVTGWASCRSPAYGQAMVYALRNLLRYLHARGLLSHALAEAVPTVPGWKPARAVRAVTGQQMAALLACCDRHSAIGRRDYAIVLLLTRLGLRASEVAGITLAGIDWRQGVLRVRGKGNILAELPLPADVGEAMADYLRRGRVRCDSPHLFVRTKAPFTRLAGTGITAVVQRACRRAGLPEVGPHRLRHAVAAQLRREGASLSEIAQLLRHQDERTTQRYAADDVEALAALARPCPDGAPL